MRGRANLIDHVLTRQYWHSSASKALRLVALIERYIVRCLYGVRLLALSSPKDVTAGRRLFFIYIEKGRKTDVHSSLPWRASNVPSDVCDWRLVVAVSLQI